MSLTSGDKVKIFFQNILRFFHIFVIFFRMGVGEFKVPKLGYLLSDLLKSGPIRKNIVAAFCGVWRDALLVLQSDIKVKMLLTFENKYKM